MGVTLGAQIARCIMTLASFRDLRASTCFVFPFRKGPAEKALLVCFMLLFAFTLRAQESSSTVVTWGCTGCGGGAVAIATGYSHALMLGRDGTVSACGTYTFFQGQSGVQVPPGLSNVIAVAAGWSDNLVLKRDGTVAGWDRFGNQTNLPTGLTNVVAIAAGVENHLALRADGMVVSLDAGNTDLPLGLTNVVAVSAGSGSIALKADGTVVACGWSPEWSNSLSELTNVVAVSAGYQEWLALKADGTVSGGGFHEIPSGLSDVQAIASSFGNDYHLSSVLKTDGTVLSWGFNFCGGGYTTNLWGPSYAVAISAGAAFNAALIGGGPPFLTSSLLNRTATVNGTAYFRIEATGARPLRYQWQFNGEPIPDATNSVLALTGVQPGQAGRYSVNVSNPSGTVTSGEAVLSVVPVMISIPPQDQLAFVRGTAQFSVVAQGDGALSYQWRHNGESIEGATNSVLQLNDVQISDAGSYSVLVSNAFGGVLSASALLTVTPILITTQPQDRVTFIGGPTVLEVVAQGKEPLTYQWALNGKPIEGGTNSMLSLTDLQPEQAGICSVTVSNAFGTAISRVVKLSVVPIASWGVFDLTTVPPDLTNVLAVSAGAYQAFALKPDGAWVSWGSGSGFPPDLTNVVAATAGFTFSLALKDNGTVVAWGGTNYGETDVPAGLTNVVEIAAQYFHSLALTADGRVAAPDAARAT